MGLPSQEVDIARNVKTIEWFKGELVSNMGTLLKAMVKNSEEVMADSLANLVAGCYLLGKRLGIGFSQLDAKIEQKAKLNIEKGHEIERWYGDFSAFLQHVKDKKR